MLTSRPDGVLLTKLPGFRKLFPYIMITRTESVVVHQQTVRVKKALALLARLNEGRSGPKYTIFHVLLAAAVRTLALRPENNRFVVGRRIYQRHAIELSFIAKKALTDDAGETNVRLAFERADTLEQVAARVWERVSAAKSSAGNDDEVGAEGLTRLPRFLVRLAMWAVRSLDYFNLLPASFIKKDPLYCSAYLANLGSIGLEAVQHHLFEWGTCPLFAVLGRIKKEVVVGDDGQPAVEDVVSTAFTVDERCTDGVNLAKTIALLKGFLEDPEPLMSPPASLPDPLALR